MNLITRLLLAAVALPVVTAVAAPDASKPTAREDISYKSYHLQVMKSLLPELAFKEGADVKEWQAKLRAKLRELLAVPAEWDRKVQTQFKRLEETEDYTRDEITFAAEPGYDAVAYLLKPKKAKLPYPVMICLQGHVGEGFNASVDPVAKGGRGIAIAAVRNGWAAIALEQRGFGRRAGAGCQAEAMKALLVGKHIAGERAFDVMRAIDFIETQKDLDARRIASMGNSTGGTTTFYAACLDDRIRLAVVSCSFCTFEQSWMDRPHCPCGYIPGIMKVADMPDMGGLIAPRHLLIVAGRDDGLAKLPGVKEGFDRTLSIFKAAGCPSNTQLIVGEGGHEFYPEQAWPQINRIRDAIQPAATRPTTVPLSVDDFDLSPPFGNAGSKVERLGENHFRLTLGAQPKHPQWPNFVQFRIKRHAKGNRLNLEVFFEPQGKNDTSEANIGAGNYRFSGGGWQFWSYDRKNWNKINMASSPKGKTPETAIIEFPVFTEDQVFVTTQNALTNEDIQALRDELKDHPLVKAHVIGTSIQGREIIRFEVSDPASDVPRNKRWAHYASNQHPVEANARWRIMGMLRWALSDAAKEFRRANVLHLVFTINPDGVANGWMRVNADGVDMNRCCRAEGASEKEETREAFIAHKDIESLMASETPLATLWSMHTAPGAVYMGVIPGPENKGQAFINALRRLAPAPDFFGSLTVQKGSAPDRWNGCVARQFGITATLVEGGQGLSKELCLATGEAIIRAIAECYQAPRPVRE